MGEHALYFVAQNRGEVQVFRIDPESGKLDQITQGPRGVRHVDVNEKTASIVYASDDFKHLADLYSAGLNGENEKKLTDVDRDFLSQLDLQDVERFTYKGADGWPVDGFFVKPVGWEAGKKYPMVLSIHGGPSGMYGVDWFHEFQVYAARGWAVSVRESSWLERLRREIPARVWTGMGRERLRRSDEWRGCGA